MAASFEQETTAVVEQSFPAQGGKFKFLRRGEGTYKRVYASRFRKPQVITGDNTTLPASGSAQPKAAGHVLEDQAKEPCDKPPAAVKPPAAGAQAYTAQYSENVAAPERVGDSKACSETQTQRTSPSSESQTVRHLCLAGARAW